MQLMMTFSKVKGSPSVPCSDSQSETISVWLGNEEILWIYEDVPNLSNRQGGKSKSSPLAV